MPNHPAAPPRSHPSRRRLGALAVAACVALSFPAGAADPYRLNVGDRIAVMAFGRPDLTGEFIVGPDDTIRLPLLGAIPAAGHTRDEVEKAVAAKLAKMLDYDATVTVDVSAYRPIFVIGDVSIPGEIMFIPGMTALDAYAKAGGTPSVLHGQGQTATGVAGAQRDLMIASATLNSMLIRRAALDAALADQAEITLPEELQPLAGTPSVSAGLVMESRALAAERADLAARLTLLEQERAHLDEEIASLEKQIQSIKTLTAAEGAELSRISGLAQRGLATSQRTFELKRSLADSDSDRYEAIAFLSRAKQGKVRLDLRAQELREEARREHMEERRAIDNEIALARARVEGARLQLAAYGQVGAAEQQGEGRGNVTLNITRRIPGGTRTFVAKGGEVLQPGDIIQVSSAGTPTQAMMQPALRRASISAPTAE